MRNTRQHSALCVFALFSSIFNYSEEAEVARMVIKSSVEKKSEIWFFAMRKTQN